MGALVTTSKAAGKAAVAFGECLASLLPQSVFERRGRKSVEDAVERARLLGKKRIVLVESLGGRVSAVQFARVRASTWEWMGAGLAAERAACGRPLARPPCCVRFSGPRGEEFADLLGAENEPCTDDASCGGVEAACGAHATRLKAGGKTRLELVFTDGKNSGRH